jgi:hypothetical protein
MISNYDHPTLVFPGMNHASLFESQLLSLKPRGHILYQEKPKLDDHT